MVNAFSLLYDLILLNYFLNNLTYISRPDIGRNSDDYDSCFFMCITWVTQKVALYIRLTCYH